LRTLDILTSSVRFSFSGRIPAVCVYTDGSLIFINIRGPTPRYGEFAAQSHCKGVVSVAVMLTLGLIGQLEATQWANPWRTCQAVH
jgi:hypothetical protein